MWLTQLRGPTVPASIPASSLYFAACAMVIAVLCGTTTGSGLALLLMVALITTRRFTAVPVLVAAGGLLLIVALQQTGNWYAGHRAARFVAVIASFGVALLTLPAALRVRLAMLSNRQIALFGVAIPAYCFFSATNGSLSSGDTRPVVPTVVQMLRHGNRNLAEWNTHGRWDAYRIGALPYFLRASARSEIYSDYPAGMELFALPAAAVLVVCDASCTDKQCTLAERITARLLTSATLVLFFLLATHFVKPLTAYVAALLLMTGSAFTSTMNLCLWQQDGVAFWILVVLLCEVKGQSRWLQAFACAAMLACRPSAVTFLVPFGCWLLAQDWRRGVVLVAGAVLCFIPWAVLYLTHYGTPFGPSMGFLKQPWQVGENLAGVLVSPARGFLIYQLWWVLILMARHPWPQWTLLLGPAIALHALLIASWPMWWGGHCYGSRLMTECVPLAGLLILGPLQSVLEKRWGPWLVAALVVLGLALHLPGGFGRADAWNVVPHSVDDHPERLWDWREPPFLYDWHL